MRYRGSPQKPAPGPIRKLSCMCSFLTRSHEISPFHPSGFYAVGDIGFDCIIGTDCWTQVYLKFSIIFRGVSFRFFRDRLQSSSSSFRSSGSLLMRTMSLALKNFKGLLVASLLWDDISLNASPVPAGLLFWWKLRDKCPLPGLLELWDCLSPECLPDELSM